jgi:excisionase family DNA binding protein
MTSGNRSPNLCNRDVASVGGLRDRRSRQTEIHFLKVAEVADSLKVSTRTVRRWIERGDLVAHRLGGAIRISETDLRAFLALHREG